MAAAAPGRGAGGPRARIRDGDDGAPATRAPLVPWFVVGFLAAVLVRATGWLPEPVLDVAAVVQQLLLATAMAALGLGVRLRSIAAVGPGRSCWARRALPSPWPWAARARRCSPDPALSCGKRGLRRSFVRETGAFPALSCGKRKPSRG